MSEAVLPEPTIVSLPFRPIGGQTTFARVDVGRFLPEARIATLTYVRDSGQINQAPLWYEYVNGLMRFVASAGSAKHRALHATHQAALLSRRSAAPPSSDHRRNVEPL